MKFLRRKERWPIALDIGSNSIKVLQLDEANGALIARACGQWQFPTIGTDPEQRSEMVVTAISEILRRGDFRGRRSVSSLSCHEMDIKNVRLAGASKSEMEKALQWEAQDRFDFDVVADRHDGSALHAALTAARAVGGNVQTDSESSHQQGHENQLIHGQPLIGVGATSQTQNMGGANLPQNHLACMASHRGVRHARNVGVGHSSGFFQIIRKRPQPRAQHQRHLGTA